MSREDMLELHDALVRVTLGFERLAASVPWLPAPGSLCGLRTAAAADGLLLGWAGRSSLKPT